jgi:hypothetical protein
MYVLNFHAMVTLGGVMAKVVLGLFAAFLATVLAARVAFFVSTDPDDPLADQPWSQNEMEFVTWNGERWTAWVRDGAFEHTPQNPDRWSRHSNSSLAFIGWEGEAWQAKVDGEEFLLAHHGDWQQPTERATALRYRDWTGKHQLRSLTQLRR